MNRIYIYIFLFLSTSITKGQDNTVLLGNSYSSNFNHLIYSFQSANHTSFKPIFKSDLSFSIDSIIESKTQSHSLSWFSRKLYNEHFFLFRGDDYEAFVSPVINLTLGKDRDNQKNTSTNTRGFIIGGRLGNKLSFYSSFLETQSVFVDYLDGFIRKSRVVPGQGYVRTFKGDGYDYAMSSGHVSYHPNNIFTFQFGHGKHFIGDGYRSLILSDNTFNYPFLRIQTSFGNIQYTNLYAEFQDINYFINNNLDNVDQIGFPKKYMSSHYFSLKATNNLNISLYESVIWRMNHAPGNTAFDVSYLNPIIMLRPVEFSLNSPDNVLVGLNISYILPESSYLYGQFVLDEFSLNNLKKDNSFWGNKYGYQLGYKNFNFLSIDNLTFQTEYNLVRPYTYAHHNPLQNYGHYNQPLAHPLGANFSETVLLLNYKIKQWEISAKLIKAKYGGDFVGNTTSYGSDIYSSTGGFAEESGFQGIGTGRPSDFGINMYQGNLTDIEIRSIDVAYIINPITNLKLNIGMVFRDFNDQINYNNMEFFHFGIKSDLFNHYYDF